jgi:hypothetical protein
MRTGTLLRRKPLLPGDRENNIYWMVVEKMTPT